MSRLIETIRVANGQIENASYHFRRMRDLHIKRITDIELPASGIHKLRIVYDEHHFEFSISPYTIRPVRSLKLITDNDIVYDKKYEDRTRLNFLLKSKGTADDILIIKNNLITDVSFANIAFRKDNTWFTPDSFLLNGTMRQNLLDNGKIKERRVSVDNLKEFTHFKLINAMLLDEAAESEVLNIR
jgi:4-amino-4-deoxychorismate lyase